MTDSQSPPLFYASDFMTKEVIAVTPDMPIGEASQLLMKHRLSGLPVVDHEKKLVGIITEYDLVSKGSLIHIPTFLKLLKDIELYRKDRALVKSELRAILSMRVKDVMNKEPLTVRTDTPIFEVVKLFSEHHRVNPIPVIDVDNYVVGVLSRFDIMRLYAPRGITGISRGEEAVAEGNIDHFLKNFEKEFILVRKSRPRFWLASSLIFLFIGFIAALFFLFRIDIEFFF